MPRNSPKLSISFEWILWVPFEWILWVPFEFSVTFELILNVSFEFSVSFELVLGIQGPVSEPKHIYCQNCLAACKSPSWKVLQCISRGRFSKVIHHGIWLRQYVQRGIIHCLFKTHVYSYSH